MIIHNISINKIVTDTTQPEPRVPVQERGQVDTVMHMVDGFCSERN